MSDTASKEITTPGWDTITAACEKLYPNQKPQHFGPVVSYRLGGQDPLQGISVWKRLHPVPHWHFVTYGFSELYDKESEDKDISGYGFELTFRLKTSAEEKEPPGWPLSFLQNLARYVFETGNVFQSGHWMTANGPIALEEKTLICFMGFAADPELPAINTPNGHIEFLQVIGLTKDEALAAKKWSTLKVLEAFKPEMPLWITDLARQSLLEKMRLKILSIKARKLTDRRPVIFSPTYCNGTKKNACCGKMP